MSTTLLRLGLWTLIVVLALYVLAETYSEEPWSELIPRAMLGQALVVAIVVTVIGVVLRIVGKGTEAVRRNRCRVCRVAIPPGALYCRAHLRSILHDEEDRTHGTRVKQR
jgi:hypothetical protein